MRIDEFSCLLEQMFEYYGRTLNKLSVKVYYEYLGQLSNEEIVNLMKWAIATQRFLPTPFEFLEKATPEISPEQVWKELMDASFYLSSQRYASNFSNIRKQTYAKLNPVAVNYLQQQGVGVTQLGELSLSQVDSLRKGVEKELKNSVKSGQKLLGN